MVIFFQCMHHVYSVVTTFYAFLLTKLKTTDNPGYPTKNKRILLNEVQSTHSSMSQNKRKLNVTTSGSSLLLHINSLPPIEFLLAAKRIENHSVHLNLCFLCRCLVIVFKSVSEIRELGRQTHMTEKNLKRSIILMILNDFDNSSILIKSEHFKGFKSINLLCLSLISFSILTNKTMDLLLVG